MAEPLGITTYIQNKQRAGKVPLIFHFSDHYLSESNRSGKLRDFVLFVLIFFFPKEDLND